MHDIHPLAEAHLKLRLGPLHRALRAAVEQQSARIARLARPDVTAQCVMPDHVAYLLADAETWRVSERGGVDSAPTPDEERAEDALRTQAAALGRPLPLDALTDRLSLTTFERDAVVLCAAAALEPAYGRVFAYIVDDNGRQRMCAEVITVCSPAARPVVLAAFEPHGMLALSGVMAPGDRATAVRMRPMSLTPLALSWVTLGRGRVESFADADAVEASDEALPPSLRPERVDAIIEQLDRGVIDAVALWGGSAAERGRVVARLAGAMPLRRVTLDDTAASRAAMTAALARGEGIWVRVTSEVQSPEETLSQRLASPAPWVVVDGDTPVRPAALLTRRRHVEWQPGLATLDERAKRWRAALPEGEAAHAEEHARRWALDGAQVEAMARLGRLEATLDGRRGSLETRDLAAASAVVLRRRSDGFAEWTTPRYRADDLVLPAAQHRRVLDLVRFAQGRETLEGAWGFGVGGVRGLFTGPPGTGKTLAASVIAGELGLGLMRIDLARVVSKWIGETEKNLEAAFAEAEASHAVLFFDEAEALFGKRGDVKSGTDRYANLEVAYLLQRLEAHRGVVILASNLKQQIDNAFMRRFEVVVHFARPAVAERSRLWAQAFPPSAPVAGDLDLDALVRLDLSGAEIHRAARTAAFLALHAGEDISMCHIVRAIQRQFSQSSRVLRPGELGCHARWLEDD